MGVEIAFLELFQLNANMAENLLSKELGWYLCEVLNSNFLVQYFFARNKVDSINKMKYKSWMIETFGNWLE